MIKLTILILFILIQITQAQEIQFERVSLLDGKLSIIIPDGFNELDEDIKKMKYPMENRPDIIYSNQNASVNITVSQKSTYIPEDKLNELKEILTTSFNNMYPTATWLKNETISINGKAFIRLELITPAIDQEIYNMILSTSLENRHLLIGFNCLKKQMEEYQIFAHQFSDSVSISKKSHSTVDNDITDLIKDYKHDYFTVKIPKHWIRSNESDSLCEILKSPDNTAQLSVSIMEYMEDMSKKKMKKIFKELIVARRKAETHESQTKLVANSEWNIDSFITEWTGVESSINRNTSTKMIAKNGKMLTFYIETINATEQMHETLSSTILKNILIH